MSQLDMSKQASKRLVSFLEDRVGTPLRVVFHYDTHSDEFEILYMRDDIAESYTREELGTHFESFRQDASIGDFQETALDTGNHHCSIRLFDDTLLFNFTLGERYNTIVSMDPEVGRDLLGFFTSAIAELKDDSERTDWSPPRWV